MKTLIFMFGLLGFINHSHAGNNLKGNGFPSGEHYNLNILGKQDNFTCPAAEYDEYGQQIFGNVIFVPRYSDVGPVSISIESGKKGPKSSPTASTLEVTDWCSESFPDSGSGQGDGAIMRLPSNDRGYKVYARITGKPTNDPHFTLTSELAAVTDENGQDLLYLGLVSSDGVFDSSGSSLTRTSTTQKGKKVQSATDITGLFEWTGDACYIQSDSDLYCLDDSGANLCSSLDLCCVDPNLDGIYDRCDYLSLVGVDLNGDGTLECPLSDTDGALYTSLTAQCRSYDSEWVFNIGDFVDVLWNLDNQGSYNIQVRFYPQ